jgi:hypothetical protein
MHKFCISNPVYMHKILTQSSGALSSSNGKGKCTQGYTKVSYGFSLVKGMTNHPMEDYHVADFMRMKDHDLGLFAIFDGHLGHNVPEYLQKNLFNNILKEVIILSNYFPILFFQPRMVCSCIFFSDYFGIFSFMPLENLRGKSSYLQ